MTIRSKLFSITLLNKQRIMCPEPNDVNYITVFDISWSIPILHSSVSPCMYIYICISISWSIVYLGLYIYAVYHDQNIILPRYSSYIYIYTYNIHIYHWYTNGDISRYLKIYGHINDILNICIFHVFPLSYHCIPIIFQIYVYVCIYIYVLFPCTIDIIYMYI